MPQFDIAFYCSQIFWLIVVFATLYLLVHKFIVPITEKILDDRQAHINTNISGAEDFAEKTDSLRKQYAIELQNISHMVENIKKEAQSSMDAAFMSKKIQMHDELKKQIANNLNDIDVANNLFWAESNDACLNLAKVLIEKITDQPVDLTLLKKAYKEIK